MNFGIALVAAAAFAAGVGSSAPASAVTISGGVVSINVTAQGSQFSGFEVPQGVNFAQFDPSLGILTGVVLEWLSPSAVLDLSLSSPSIARNARLSQGVQSLLSLYLDINSEFIFGIISATAVCTRSLGPVNGPCSATQTSTTVDMTGFDNPVSVSADIWGLFVGNGAVNMTARSRYFIFTNQVTTLGPPPDPRPAMPRWNGAVSFS